MIIFNQSSKSAVQDIPIGIDATGERTETDLMGRIEVPADRYWGAQTQRSLVHFSIGNDRMPKRVDHAYGYVKKAAAVVNQANGRLPGDKGRPSSAPPTKPSRASSTPTTRSTSGKRAAARRAT